MTAFWAPAQTATVFGGTGFLGRRVVRRLREAVNSRIGQFSAGHSAFALRLQARPSGILIFEATMRSLLLPPGDS